MKLKLNLKKTHGLDCGSLKFTKLNPQLDISDESYKANKGYVDNALEAGLLGPVLEEPAKPAEPAPSKQPSEPLVQRPKKNKKG